jgi:hypothetical protein
MMKKTMKKLAVLTAILAVALVWGLMLAGCDTGTSPGPGSGTEGFSVSGSFTKTADIGGGNVNFDLKSNSAFGRAVTADSYTISGVLEDGDVTIRLSGSYDPNTGNWSVSARSSAIIYTLDGNVDSAGVSRGSSATIAVKSGTEWVPYIFAVTEAAVSIPNAAEAEESETGGTPSFAQGYWHSNASSSEGSLSVGSIVSGWKVAVKGEYTTQYGTMPIEQSWTILEYEEKGGGAYEVIACYPEYVWTSDNLAKALAAYLGINETTITRLTEFPPSSGFPNGRWVYAKADSATVGGFSNTEMNRLPVFFATGGWEKWATANPAGITKAKRYIKAKTSFTNNNTTFTMIRMGVTSPYLTVTFDSLAALKAAEGSMIELDNSTISFAQLTFTR